MASLLNAALPSDDEEDTEYTPVDNGGICTKKRTRAAAGKRAAKEKDDSGADPEEPVAAPKVDLMKRAKIDALWLKLNQGGSQLVKREVSLAALCRPVKSARSSDEMWKKQLGISSIGVSRQVEAKDPEEAKAAAAAALAAAKEAASLGASKNYGKIAVTETRKFAGKDIQVVKHVDKDNALAEPKPKTTTTMEKFLAEIEKTKKVSVLDKSKMDWHEFKKTDQTVDEELEAYKKSSNKYLDKVEFLQRAELREYEHERDRRLGSDVRTRGRL